MSISQTSAPRDSVPVVLLDDNLFTSARVASALRSSGRQVLVARGVEPIQTCELALINLGSRTLDGVALIERVRTKFPSAHVLGFCGHLEVDIRSAAKAAGIDRLLTNESVAELLWLNDVPDAPTS